MKLNRKWTMVAALLLSVALATGGTLAYLTDTDSAVNVMTLGNVSIEQIEQERNDAGEFVDFTQDKPALPAVGEIKWDDDAFSLNGNGFKMFDDELKNVVDKIVSVKNTGKSDAYVRTIIAIEDPEGAYENMIHVNQNTGGEGDPVSSDWTTITVGGVRYSMIVYTYEEALKPNEASAPSLLQVFLDSATTNEDVALLGDTWEIRVVSQAVQADGFADAATALDTAFGKVSANSHPWMDVDGKTDEEGDQEPDDFADVGTVGELNSALAHGVGSITLTNNVAADSFTITESTDVDLNLQSNTLEGTLNNDGNLTVSGGTIKSAAAGIENNGVAVLNNVTMNAGSPADYSNISLAGSETTYNNVEIDSAGGGISAVDGAQVVFNSGSVSVNTASTSGRYNFYAEGEGTKITINDGTFSFSKTLNQKRAYIYAGPGTTVEVKGGTFGPASTRSGYTAGILGNGTVTITGGIFGFDPSQWVAEGYQAVKGDDGNWTVSAK